MKWAIFTIITFFAYGAGAQSFGDIPDEYRKKLEGIKSEKKRLKKYAKYLKKNSPKKNIPSSGSLKGEVTQFAKDSLEGSIPEEVEAGVITVKDTSDLKQVVKETAIGVVRDSLNSRQVHLPHDVKVDSSMMQQATEELKAGTKSELEKQAGVDLPQVTLDSTFTETLGEQAKSRTKEALEDHTGVEVPEISLDSAGRASMAQRLETEAEEALKNKVGIDELGDKGDLAQLDAYKSQLQSTQQELQQAMAKRQLKEKMTSHAREYISKHADKIQQVQSKMGELKKKYSYVPNSNDLSTAKKRTSLKDEPLGKRLVLGGNFNVSRTNPVNVDISPVIGYKINKLFEAGVTGSYRAQFEGSRNGIGAREKSTYGYSLFVNHMVFRSFFGYLEGENISRVIEEQDTEKRVWDQTLLAGIGRKFSITKWLEMQAIVTYNFLHDNQNGVYDNPIVFKTGIRVKR